MKRRRHIMITFSLRERPYLRRVLHGINAYARQKGDWELFLPYFYPRLEAAELAGYHAPIDAVIAGVPGEEHLLKLKELRLPTVLINYLPRPEWASAVAIDYAQVAALAIQHFSEQGIRSFATVGSLNHLKHDHREFMTRLHSAAANSSIEMVHFTEGPAILTHGLSVQNQLADLALWLRSLPSPCAVICGDDEYAGRVKLAAFRAELQIGHDLLLLGCGDDRLYCESLSPNLSSIGLGYRALGWEAAAQADKLLDFPGQPHSSLLIRDAEIRVRRSSRRSGKAGSLVARAVSHIWSNVGTISGVDAVARQFGVSRTTLGRHFNAEVGHGPLQEIHASRIAHACDLLMDSSLPIAEIAHQCGFADQAHMSRQLRKVTGKSPGQWQR